MKLKTTNKELKENYFCVSCGYCNLQYLLTYENPIAYNCGVYGWNYDAYILRNEQRQFCLCTGYRNQPNELKKQKNAFYNLCKQYNEKAKKLYYSSDDYQTRKKKTKRLLNNFINKTIQLIDQER